MAKLKSYTLQDVFNVYIAAAEADGLQTKTQRSRFKRLQMFHNMNMNSITPEHILRWKIEMLKKYKTGTCRELQSLGIALYHFAEKYDMIGDINPFKKVSKAKESPKKLRIFTKSQTDILFDFLSDRDVLTGDDLNALSCTALHTGMRPSELARLTKRSYINENQLRVKTKNKNSYRERIIYIRDADIDSIKYLPWPDDPEELLFKNVKKMQRYVNRAINILGFNDGITKSHERLTFYSLRHTFCTKLVQSGAPLPVVQEITGHRSFRSLERYIHLETDVVQEALNNMKI